MRIKALTRYNFTTTRNYIIVFFLCFMAATLLSSVVNATTTGNVVFFGTSREIDGQYQTWSSGIVAFSIFMLVSSLIGSQSDTRFLITRSVSRKEIFTANAVFLCPLAAIMSALQMLSIYIDGFVRWCLGRQWRGLALDFQIMQAPDMNNILVFFLVSFSILLAFGAISYLLGSLLARWKLQTVVAICLLFCLFVALAGSGNIDWGKFLDAFTFMYTDANTGLLIALKQIIFAAVVMAISFPIMRRITAAKQ